MFVSVLVNNTHMICNVGTTRSQETVSLQRQVELLLVKVSQLDRERRVAEEMAKQERRRADAEKIRADAAETRACNEKTRADSAEARADSAEARADSAEARADSAETRADGAEARVKEVETEKMGIEWTNLSFRCYHQRPDNYKQASDMRSFDLYISHMHVHV